MPSTGFEWITIYEVGQPIGAVGFINNRAAVFVSFFDKRDYSRDQQISLGEVIYFQIISNFVDNPNLRNVMEHAAVDLRVIEKDATVGEAVRAGALAGSGRLAKNAAYTAYMSGIVGRLCGYVTGKFIANDFVDWVVRQGMENVVESAFKAVTGDPKPDSTNLKYRLPH